MECHNKGRIETSINVNSKFNPKQVVQNTRERLRWLSRRTLHTWINTTCMPEKAGDWGIDPSRPVFYVLDTYAYSSLLILDEVLEKAQLPLASKAFDAKGVTLSRSFGANRRYQGVLYRTLKRQRHSPTLRSLIQQVDPRALGEAGDIQIVPVSILVGRAPDPETGWLKLLFSENWGGGGRLQRLIGTWIHGRHTLVQVGQPMTLAELFEHTDDSEQAIARISRVIRVYFKRIRSSAIGPDRSHLRTVIDGVIQSPTVQTAIDAKAKRDGMTRAKAEDLAQSYAREIAANYSYSFVMFANKVLTWFLYKIFRGVEVKHFESFRKIATGYEVVYVPCHRSHIDYLLLSYLLYHRGFVPPHVAAGLNLNLPFVGPLIRRGGGFFLRRSFRSKPLYAAVFNEYVATILAKGVALEYFIEGGRSRTGRLLPAKAGMLSMTVRAFLAQPKRPVLFQPVSIAYERLAEGNAYISELSGQQKKPESLSDFKNVWNIIRKNYGEVTVSFGEPIFLNDRLDAHYPAWQAEPISATDRPEWVPALVDGLAEDILVNINRAAHINPIALLSIGLLASPKHALGEADLRRFLGLLQSLFQATPYSDRITVTDMSPEAIIEYGLTMEVATRQAHQSGAIISTDESTAVLLTYFRNNAAHLLAIGAWVGCCYLNVKRLKRARLIELTERVYPFLKQELFLPWDSDALSPVVNQTIDQLIEAKVLAEQDDQVVRQSGSEPGAHLLRLLANTMSQTFERYFITIAVLIKNGSGKISKQQLESLCALCAERVTLLQAGMTGELHDKALLTQFISSLQKQGHLSRNDEGMLVFSESLERLNRDARLVLDRDMHYTIVQSAPLLAELSKEDNTSKE